jgi:hypothetical protein
MPLWVTRRRLDLVRLRHLFVHTGIALTEVTLVTSWTFDAGRDPIPPLAWAIASGLIGSVVVGLEWIARRPLPMSSSQDLGAAFRAATLIRVGFAASPGLCGIAGSYLFDRPELSWLGTVFSLGLLTWVAPSKTHLDRIDEELRSSGSRLTVRTALEESA